MTPAAPLRVGVDGFNLALPHGTGVATYARNLSCALRGLGRAVDLIYGLDAPRDAAPELREAIFFAALGDRRPSVEPVRSRTLRSALKRLAVAPWPRALVEVPATGAVVRASVGERLPPCERLFTLGGLFNVAARHFRRYGRFLTVRAPDPPAIMHWTYPLPLRLAGARNLYTIHDLVPLRLPATTLDDRRYYHRLVRACLASGDHVCTVSETSRRDILSLFHADPDRVTNTYQVVPPEPPPPPQELADRLRTLFGLEPQGYFLFFGAIEPKKNVGRLIEAYLSADVETPLVIAGPRGWLAEGELGLLVRPAGAGGGRIRRMDFLPGPHLAALRGGARAVLFPSLYEGFGLPLVEGMAAGAPVLAGAAGALPEVAGEAALLVDPYDVGAMAGAIRRLEQDGELRARLAAAGPARAALFSLDAYQRRLTALHDRVLGAPVARAVQAPLPFLPTACGVPS